MRQLTWETYPYPPTMAKGEDDWQSVAGRTLQMQIQGSIALRPTEIVDFVINAQNGAGLTISGWKSRDGWNQMKAEAMIDLLAQLNLVTERSRGTKCEWTDAARNMRGELSVGKVVLAITENPPTPLST